MTPLSVSQRDAASYRSQSFQTAYSLAAVVPGIKRVLPDTACSSSPGPRPFKSFRVSRSGACHGGCGRGAPDGGLPSVSATLGHALSDRTGAGLVTAHGFRTNRIAVASPLVRTTSYPISLRDSAKRRGVYREFKHTVRDVAPDGIDFYFEFRSRLQKTSQSRCRSHQADSLSKN